MAHKTLSHAKKAKNDEFYTQWADIEREMNAYLEYNADVFRGKTVLLPCDDPDWSNFTKYFALHFKEYGLKKLISTSYAPEKKVSFISYEPTSSERDNPLFDGVKSVKNGRVYVLEESDIGGDGTLDIDDLRWSYLEGDGDFRSEEVTALRDQADIIITNPPFSLFHDFVTWLVDGGVEFSIVGSRSAIGYQEVFPLLRDDKIWIGKGFHKGDAFFQIPDAARTTYASGVFNEATRTVHFRNTTWFTNIEHGRRHEPLQLMTAADNFKYSKDKKVRGIGYLRYDNYDAIEVPSVEAIPSDYEGVMGVPVTFLDKYNPEQFEIMGIAQTPVGEPIKTYPRQTQVSATGERSLVRKLNDSAAIKVSEPPIGKTYYEVEGSIFIKTYSRVLIRRRGDQ
jgi:hypothetical protein